MGTARGVAKLFSMVANGQLFKPSTVELFNKVVVRGNDECMGFHNEFGYGFSHYFTEGDEVSNMCNT